MVEAITLDQVKAQARRLIDSEHLIVTVVGKPEGLKSTGTGGLTPPRVPRAGPAKAKHWKGEGNALE